MSQRNSGYERIEADLYETPAWVTRALLPHLRRPIGGVWEPASGNGKMVEVLMDAGFCVSMSDLHTTGHDFLTAMHAPDGGKTEGIFTNPPYGIAREFCEHALKLMQPVNGSVAMLLRTDFDHAVSRVHLFRDCPAFSKKIVLMKRIVWFVEADGKPKASPSYNHAWYIWDWRHQGPPTIAYGPDQVGVFNQNVNLPNRRKSGNGMDHAGLLAHPPEPAVAGSATGPAPRRQARRARRQVRNGTGELFGEAAP